VVHRYLQRFPAAAAVLIAPVPVNGMLAANWQIGFRQPRALLRSLLKRDFAQFYRSPELVHDLLFLPTTPRPLVEECAKRIGPESFRAALEMLLPLRGSRSFGCPVLLIAAGRDRIVPVRHVRRTAAAFGAALAVFENAAHNAILDIGWEDVAARIAGWLRMHALDVAPRETTAAREITSAP
jgi:pimeloyl-ACP methyl ester carboxylesterase